MKSKLICIFNESFLPNDMLAKSQARDVARLLNLAPLLNRKDKGQF